jgi:hypothetical protein
VGGRESIQGLMNPRHRSLASEFVEVWETEAAGVTPEVAVSNLTAALVR